MIKELEEANIQLVVDWEETKRRYDEFFFYGLLSWLKDLGIDKDHAWYIADKYMYGGGLKTFETLLYKKINCFMYYDHKTEVAVNYVEGIRAYLRWLKA